MSFKRKSLETWINEAMTDTDKEGQLSMISLVHMVGMQTKEIHTTKFGGKTIQAKELAEMLRGKAETHCQDIPGVQTFQLLAFYGNKQNHEASLPFVVNVSQDNNNGLWTEPPTEQGRTQMEMRRGEMLFQQVYRRQQVMDETMIRMLELSNRHNEKLLRENQDAFGIVKDMIMEKALNDHNRQMEALKFERATGERKKWMSWAPMLINTILGREVFPQSAADTSLVEAIAESLGEDDIMKLAGAIKPELMGPLAARMQAYMVKKEKEESDIKRLSEFHSPDPEADAAGDIVRVNGNGKS